MDSTGLAPGTVRTTHARKQRSRQLSQELPHCFLFLQINVAWRHLPPLKVRIFMWKHLICIRATHFSVILLLQPHSYFCRYDRMVSSVTIRSYNTTHSLRRVMGLEFDRGSQTLRCHKQIETVSYT